MNKKDTMKIRVKDEDGIELSTICRQLKLQAPDGKIRETDCVNIEVGILCKYFVIGI